MTTNPLGSQDMVNLYRAYELINEHFFQNRLPEVVMTWQRKDGARGYYWNGQFYGRDDKSKIADEIALNPATFEGRTDKEIASTLLHEATHCLQQHYQEEYGEPSRNGYHNKQWAKIMLAVGLKPEAIDNPERMTGQKVTHSIIEGGQFDQFYDLFMADWFTISWNAHSKSKAKKPKEPKEPKSNYVCPSCDVKVRGPQERSFACMECDEIMQEME